MGHVSLAAASRTGSAALAVPADAVVNLTDQLAADGTLRWDVPEGDWIILRTGMTPTGTRNSPASPEGQGLEVDKMNRQAAEHALRRLHRQAAARGCRPATGSALKHVVADSYEMGSQNWTDGFGPIFRERYGYDPLPWLPVLTGRIVGSADQSNRFLWDLRRLVADRVATDYVGGLRDLCRPHGLQLWLENYGHWGFPAEFLQYGGQSDRIGGEFWVDRRARLASNAARPRPQPTSTACRSSPPKRSRAARSFKRSLAASKPAATGRSAKASTTSCCTSTSTSRGRIASRA